MASEDAVSAQIAEEFMAIFHTRDVAIHYTGEYYSAMYHGRLLVWNAPEMHFNMMMMLPRVSGVVDLFILPIPILNIDDFTHATRVAEAEFRQHATYTVIEKPWGEVAEENFLRGCLDLGFGHAYYGENWRELFSVRRGTPQEDIDEKTDLVLEFPRPSGRKVSVVPVQLTTKHSRNVRETKKSAIDSRLVAYAPLNEFFPSVQEAKRVLQKAASTTEDCYELWWFGEIVKVVSQRYLRRCLYLPRQCTPLREYITPEYLTCFSQYFSSDILNRLLWTRSGRNLGNDGRVILAANLLWNAHASDSPVYALAPRLTGQRYTKSLFACCMEASLHSCMTQKPQKNLICSC